MSDYVKITDFSVKDTLVTGNPAKVILGTELDAELDAIATALSSKQDASGSSFSNATLAGVTSLTGTLEGDGTIDGGTY